MLLPPVEEIYPPGDATRVRVEGITAVLEGERRPGHFEGVTTVVAKLFAIVQPDRAYFGEKDGQQLRVIERMTRDLLMPIEVVACPTVREPDGLARSSRNVYLSAEERAQAPALHAGLRAAAEAFADGMRDAASLRRIVPRAGRGAAARGYRLRLAGRFGNRSRSSRVRSRGRRCCRWLCGSPARG